jgi:vacuolar-type H+-ATPase subunit H
MGDFTDVIRSINQLESMLPSDFSCFSQKADLKNVWRKIKEVNNQFKGVKFPTKEERESNWERFQALVDKTKDLQEREREDWDERKRKSKELRDEIISQAHAARPSSGFADALLALLTGGVSMILSSIIGPFDERKYELQSCSKALKEGWRMLGEYKHDMLGKDKQEAFNALNNAKELLEDAWEEYKREREEVFEEYKRDREERRRNFVDRIQSQIEDLEARRDRLTEVLSHKESHLSDLHDKLSDAWSDDFRERVSGWIDEEESAIEKIQDKLNKIEDWILEARHKLD